MNNKIRIELKILVLSFIFGFTLCWILPNAVTNLIKPIPVCFMFVRIIQSHKLKVNSPVIVLWLFMALVAMNAIFFGYDNGGIYAVAYIMNILYFGCIIYFCNTEAEYIYVLLGCKNAALLLAVAVAVSNPIIKSIHSSTIKLLWGEINKNSVAYLIACGLCVICIMIQNTTNTKKKILYCIELVIMLYSALYPMSRGGFATAFVTILLVWIPDIIKKIKTFSISKIIGVIIVIGIVIFLFYKIPEAYKIRLFSLNNYKLGNSGDRNQLWKEALEMVGNWFLIGKGLGYYQTSTGTGYGAHNCFVDIFVSTGLLGLAMYVYTYLYILLKSRWNNYVLAMFTIPFFAAFFESQNSYQIWVPLAFCIVMIKLGDINWKKYFKQE